MTAWLNEHQDLKEELFTAFKPEHGDVQTGLALFKTLKTEFPQKNLRVRHSPVLHFPVPNYAFTRESFPQQ